MYIALGSNRYSPFQRDSTYYRIPSRLLRILLRPRTLIYIFCLSLTLGSFFLMKYCYEQEMQRQIIQEERANWKHYLSNNVPAYNQSQYVGRGIVFTTYAPTVNITFASINILRDNGIIYFFMRLYHI